MAEIPDLVELPSGSASDNDLLLIHDISAPANSQDKNIKKSSLLNGVAMDGGNHNFGTSQITDLTIATSLVFPGSLSVTDIVAASVTLSPSGIAAGASETVTATLTGAATADFLSWALTGALPDGMTLQVWISAADQISAKFCNTTTSTISGASYTARVMAVAAS